MAAPEILPPDQAVSLFYNGHRIAKEGDPPSKWMAMNRTSSGEPVLVTPMPPGIHQAIMDGRFYLAEGVTEAPTPVEKPTNVDIPYVSGDEDEANCTMGNWNGRADELRLRLAARRVADRGRDSGDLSLCGRRYRQGDRLHRHGDQRRRVDRSAAVQHRRWPVTEADPWRQG